MGIKSCTLGTEGISQFWWGRLGACEGSLLVSNMPGHILSATVSQYSMRGRGPLETLTRVGIGPAWSGTGDCTLYADRVARSGIFGGCFSTLLCFCHVVTSIQSDCLPWGRPYDMQYVCQHCLYFSPTPELS